MAFREGNAKGQKVAVYLNCAYKQMVISRHSCILGLYLYGKEASISLVTPDKLQGLSGESRALEAGTVVLCSGTRNQEL